MAVLAVSASPKPAVIAPVAAPIVAGPASLAYTAPHEYSPYVAAAYPYGYAPYSGLAPLQYTAGVAPALAPAVSPFKYTAAAPFPVYY